LLVVDMSESLEDIERKLTVCLDTIQTIGATAVPIITALNKIDLLKEGELQEKTSSLKVLAPNSVSVSALNKINIPLLKQEMMCHLRQYVQASFSIPLKSDYTLFLNWLFSRAKVQSLNYEADTVHVVFESVPWFAEKVRERVTELGGTFEKD